MLGLQLFKTKRKSRVSQADVSNTSASDKVSPTVSQSVSVDLSVSEKVKSLSSEPPVNIEVVNEIRPESIRGPLPY